MAFAQKERISGVVVDANNEPVIGATVMESGTQNGAVTDIDGNFTLSVEAGKILQNLCNKSKSQISGYQIFDFLAWCA